MRKNLLLCAFCALLLSSCDNDKKPLYIDLATVNQQSVLYLDLDGGHRVVADNYRTTAATGSRALVTYSYNNIFGEGSDYYANVDIYDFAKILTKDVVLLSDSTSIDFGDDPFLAINQMNIGGGYLNAVMSFTYGSKPHLVNLVMDSDSTTTGSFYLELRQNGYDNPAQFIVTSMASFNLSSVKDIMTDQGVTLATLNVAVNLGDSLTEVIELMYDIDSDSLKPLSLEDSLFDYIEYVE